MKKWIIGNWKMHGDAALAKSLSQAAAMAAAAAPNHVKVVLCPPATLISQVVGYVQASRVSIGGQDCHGEALGAFTGNICASMLKDAGCEFVIVGHSERRMQHGEGDALVRAKAQAAIAAGLIPVICIGESAQERDGGKAEQIVASQVENSIPQNAREDNFILAYEPVWAIGTGRTATTADIAAMHEVVAKVAAKQTGLAPEKVSVLYGGSVKADNAADILNAPGVAGVLVGGASLKADEFSRIIAGA